ncbi:MAG: selenide, water dikinase SelD [Spirochaetes bacterium GWD1_61_31]|nr:MAG: selenide, water dikinase SelD [Spirochaetes bacterium GWB1_60_80]OHD34441.1 MAG: selenide, water dikinase SelD [Spirochaetes bacterium GWC1_61_12]OHD38627.1 MAG: selenide, water dikinase SelD [Spirochaetes bacterium GWD1_61_31]OHD43155.1 MAG: selenide, water dikinase SelD [Spirochaetes bacterium GWE1_60_18]OHD58730.1 MAG: selenide, water dikinase SelD [Spirochaetes bacterium GWF1_60_12]HAP43473.1 selenide, water dikinase SelD [Spirochaetaceae bacterium]
MEDATGLIARTRFSGCGAKLGPGILEKALCGLNQPAWPGLVTDFSGNEDAGLFRLGNGQDLAQTVDFFPPIVDDPFLFGRIAAANALSDIYAMGARPITALALVCFPVRDLPLASLRAMMEGGLDALSEAGCALVGGHSIEDSEPKLGYMVTGLVESGQAWRNNTVREGLSLILTKPIGTGLVNMAMRADCVSAAAREAAWRSMAQLNQVAAGILGGFSVAACTDVTGFGLLGHAAEMAQNEVCGLTLSVGRVALLPDVMDYAAMGLVPEGTRRNREGRGQAILNAGACGAELFDILFDPQTSGGLLAAVPQALADGAVQALQAAGLQACLVGESGGPPGKVSLIP